MKKNYIKFSISIIIITIVLVVFSSFVISLYRNRIIINKNGTILKDSKIYYNVKGAVIDYFNILSNENSYYELKESVLYNSDLTYEEFNTITSSYYGFSLEIDKIYELGDNTYRCEYTLSQPSEALEGYINYEEMIDESIYNNVVVLKFNKEFNKYKVMYNKLELKGGSVYEK